MRQRLLILSAAALFAARQGAGAQALRAAPEARAAGRQTGPAGSALSLAPSLASGRLAPPARQPALAPFPRFSAPAVVSEQPPRPIAAGLPVRKEAGNDPQDFTFGFELSFTNPTLAGASYGVDGTANSPQNRAAMRRLARRAYLLCRERGDCAVKPARDRYGDPSYLVEFRRGEHAGLWLRYATDPGCVEIQGKPMTLAEIKARADLLSQFTFEAALAEKLHPSWSEGGGHIHIGALGDARLFRNFVVDTLNHPELALGGLENDAVNAPPLARSSRMRAAFVKSLAEYDAGLRKHPDASPQRELAKRLQEDVYAAHRGAKSPADAAKYQALSVSRMADDRVAEEARTVELRSVRTHLSLAQMIAVMELLRGRLRRLEASDGLVPFLDREPPRPGALLRRMRRYVEESGVEWKKFVLLIPSRFLWRERADRLARFLASSSAAFKRSSRSPRSGGKR